MKKKIIIALIIIALFIPTYIAVAYYIAAQKAPVTERTVESLTLNDLDGTSFVFDKESKESKDMIEFFINMNDSAEKVAELPDQLKKTEYYSATYKSYNKDKEYKYFFTSNPNEAYYVDAHNRTYRITPENATAFLAMSYAESTFESATEPELTVSNTGVLEPVNIDWKYKAGGGKYISTSYKGNANVDESFPVSGGLSLSFSNTPDYINVKITKGDEVIFNDIYENLTKAIIGETNNKFDIEVNAKWYEATDKEYHGEANYKFTANVSAPASFYLGETTIEQGEMVVLSGKNIVDINAIGFKSEPAINYTPVFYKEGDYVVALIPISLDLEYSDKYVFTLSSGGLSEELTLNVTKRANKATLHYNASAELVNRTRTAATIDAFKGALKSTVLKNEATRYWTDVFEAPVSRSIRAGFGRVRKISSSGEEYVHTGVDYITTTNDQIKAANAGKVVYVGEQIVSGKLVVVDHGYGLKSWYMHMSDITVSVGDIVEKGATLGIAGSTGFTTGCNLHYELTVNGVSVSPYPLNEEGIKMYLGESNN